MFVFVESVKCFTDKVFFIYHCIIYLACKMEGEVRKQENTSHKEHRF